MTKVLRKRPWIVLIMIAIALAIVGFLFIPNEKETALSRVASFPEVKEYLKVVPNAHIAIDKDEANQYLIHVYEIKDGHTATFNWYIFDKKTKEIKLAN